MLELRKLLLSSAHSLKEGNEGHESFIVSGFTELLHQGLGLLLGQLLSEVGKKTEQLVGKHGVVVIFVIELQDLNKVMETSLNDGRKIIDELKSNAMMFIFSTNFRRV